MRHLLLSAVLAALIAAAGPAAARTLVVGSISGKPDKEIKTFNPFAQHLARQLKDAGIDQGKVVVASGITDMAAKMRMQQVDVFIDSPFPAVAVSRLAESRIILRRWKKGQADFNAVFVVRADSPIRALADLKGRMLAFEDPYSTTGYFLPKSALLHARHALREFPTGSAAVLPRETGFVFSGEKEATLLWVARGKVAAGAVGVHDLEEFRKAQPNALRVIHETESVPRHLVSVRKDLDEALVKRIREVLLVMDQTDEGRGVLASFEQTVRFDDLPGGVQQSLAPILRLTKDIDREIGQR